MRRWLVAVVSLGLVVGLVQGVPASSQEGLPSPDPSVEPSPEPTPEPTPSLTPTPIPTPDPVMCELGPYVSCPGVDLSGRDLRGLVLTGANFIGARLDRVAAAGVVLARADLVVASLDGAVVDGADLERADLTHAVMVGASARSVRAAGVDASRANMSGSDLSGGDFAGGNFVGANLAGVNAAGASFVDANVRGADLRGASVVGADFAGADLSGVTWVDGSVCADGSVGECRAGGQEDPDVPGRCVIEPYARCAKANLAGRDLRGVDLTGADLLEAMLDQADASEATLVNVDAARASMLGVVMNRAVVSDANFTGAQLMGAQARRVAGSGVDASRADVGGGDFSKAVFTGATFAGANATQAKFAEAVFVGADLSTAKFVRADVSGVDFTNAVLRRADLRGATITGAVFTGADLSGATWTNGRTCAEGSIGQCTPTPTTTTTDTDNLPSSMNVIDFTNFINSSLSILTIVSQCQINRSEGRSCFDGGGVPIEQRFNEIDRTVARLQAQVEDLSRQVNAGFGAIIVNQKQGNVRDLWLEAQNRLLTIERAAQKQQELMQCLRSSLDPSVPCFVSDVNGNEPQPYVLNSVEDLYFGSNIPIDAQPGSWDPSKWRPTDAMKDDSGPLARFLHAALYQFGGKRQYAASNLNKTGRELQALIAGTSERPDYGLLETGFDLFRARANADIGGPTSVNPVPAFVSASQLAQMIEFTNYLIGVQASYFGTVISALQWITVGGQDNPTAKDLQSQVLEGVAGQPQFALAKQSGTYSFSSDAPYSIDFESTVPVTQHSNRPERVGFVLGSDRTLYRIQHVHGPTEESSAHATFDFPTFDVLTKVSSSLINRGAKMSTVQRRFPYIIPDGEITTWWGSYGRSYKVVDLAQPYPSSDRFSYFLMPDGAPGTGVFGENVVAARHNVPCTVPVRMWDARADFRQNYIRDRGVDTDVEFRPNVRAKKSTGSGYFNLNVNAEAAFYDIVTSGAAPSFNLNVKVDSATKKNPYIVALQGEGFLWRCGGRRDTYWGATRAVPASFVSVTPIAASGGYKKLFN